jgi:hypothetical protein
MRMLRTLRKSAERRIKLNLGDEDMAECVLFLKLQRE